MFLQNLVTAAALGSIYALISIGMTMVYGLLKILHVAHAGVYVFGALLGLLAYRLTGSIFFAFPAAVVGCAIMGLLIYQFVYRRVQDEKPLIPLIVGIGLYTAMTDAFRLAIGPYSIAFEHDLGQAQYSLGNFYITFNQMLVIGCAGLLLAMVWFVVNRTRTGLAWRASAQDRETAMGIGVNSKYFFGLNFMFGSALAGIAGVLVALYYSAVNPNMGDVWAYKVFVVMVLGGLGNVTGTVVAAYLLGITETYVIAYWGYILPRDAIAFICMIFVLIFMPKGVMGKRRQV